MFDNIFGAAAVRLFLFAVALGALVSSPGAASAGQIIQSFNLGSPLFSSSQPFLGSTQKILLNFDQGSQKVEGFDPTLGTLLNTEIAVTGIFSSYAVSFFTQLPRCASGVLAVTCGGHVSGKLLHSLNFQTSIGTISPDLSAPLNMDRSADCNLRSGALIPLTCAANFGSMDFAFTGVLNSSATSFLDDTITWNFDLFQSLNAGAAEFGQTTFSTTLSGRIDVTYTYAATTPPGAISAPASAPLFLLALAGFAWARQKQIIRYRNNHG